MLGSKFSAVSAAATVVLVFATAGVYAASGTARLASKHTITRTISLANPYKGTAALHHYQAQAASHPKSAEDQLEAGVACYQNRLAHKAIAYYAKALKLSPHFGIAANNIGNVYRNVFHQDKLALQYYLKATHIDSSYDYGWYNLAYTENVMGKKSLARHYATQSLRALPKSDPLYRFLKQWAK